MKNMKLKLFKYKFYLTACEIKIQPPPSPQQKKNPPNVIQNQGLLKTSTLLHTYFYNLSSINDNFDNKLTTGILLFKMPTLKIDIS